MTLRNIFLQSPTFRFNNNVFYQRDAEPFGEFEKVYIALREKENRVYPDKIVRVLPDVPSQHPRRKEWQARKFSAKKLMAYLVINSRHPRILELGCGNGWLSNQLAAIPDSEVIGIDINETELLQAGRVFSDKENLSFAYADILKVTLPHSNFDYIILASSIQYFRNLDTLLQQLLALVSKKGEIHILDSPFYKRRDLASAQSRSNDYFSSCNSEFAQFYYHHSWETLNKYAYTVLNNPKLLKRRILSAFTVTSPFPWLRIRP